MTERRYEITHEQMLAVALTELRRQREQAAEYERAVAENAKKGLGYPYCKHGTWIGWPGGPDYLCPWCEDGDEPDHYTYALRSARAQVNRDQAEIDELENVIIGVIRVIAGPLYNDPRKTDPAWLTVVNILSEKQKAILAKYLEPTRKDN